LPAPTLKKAVTRSVATWKSKGALKKGANIGERIENLYSLEDLVDNSTI
jgi:hypothetical protein